MKERKIYYVYFRKFYSDARFGGYFFDPDKGLRTVSKARDAYVTTLRSSASTPNLNNQAATVCVIECEEIKMEALS